MIELTKVCTKCDIEKGVGKYNKSKRGKYGVISECKVCFNQRAAQRYEANKETLLKQKAAYKKANRHIGNAHNAKRKVSKLQSTPAWVDLEAIKGMYQLATIFNRTGMNLHVDHIIPLQSDLVCGLHCESNMQLMPASDNISKGNRHWSDQWV